MCIYISYIALTLISASSLFFLSASRAPLWAACLLNLSSSSCNRDTRTSTAFFCFCSASYSNSKDAMSVFSWNSFKFPSYMKYQKSKVSIEKVTLISSATYGGVLYTSSLLLVVPFRLFQLLWYSGRQCASTPYQFLYTSFCSPPTVHRRIF